MAILVTKINRVPRYFYGACPECRSVFIFEECDVVEEKKLPKYGSGVFATHHTCHCNCIERVMVWPLDGEANKQIWEFKESEKRESSVLEKIVEKWRHRDSERRAQKQKELDECYKMLM